MPEVTFVVPSAREVREYEDLPGRIEAIENVDIKAQINGLLKGVHFQEGAEVKKGDLLYSIDPREYQAEADLAAANVRQAEARLAQTRSEYERARRTQTAISAQELEARLTAMNEAQAAVQSAQAMYAKASLNLDYTEIRAPISGKISRTEITPGNLVRNGDTLTRIVGQDPVYVYFDAPERAILRWKKTPNDSFRKDNLTSQAQALVGLLNEKGFPREAQVDFADNQVKEGTGTLELRGVLSNSDRRLLPGMFARVRISLDKPHETLLVPERAIGFDQGQRFLYVIGADDQVERRTVEVGQLYDGLRAIINGVSGGERIVLDGVSLVQSGIKVRAAPVDQTKED